MELLIRYNSSSIMVEMTDAVLAESTSMRSTISWLTPEPDDWKRSWSCSESDGASRSARISTDTSEEMERWRGGSSIEAAARVYTIVDIAEVMLF